MLQAKISSSSHSDAPVVLTSSLISVFTISINSFVHTDTASDRSNSHSSLQVLLFHPLLVFILAWPFIPFAGNGLSAAGVSR
jgi:hypothetical protein